LRHGLAKRRKKEEKIRLGARLPTYKIPRERAEKGKGKPERGKKVSNRHDRGAQILRTHLNKRYYWVEG